VIFQETFIFYVYVLDFTSNNSEYQIITFSCSIIDMTSPSGTLLLTGANGGIATGFISEFLKSPYATSCKGYYTVRNVQNAENLRTVLQSSAFRGHDYEIGSLDMSTLDGVRSAATAINKRVSDGSLPPIRALVLNAGIQELQQDFTKDGIERTFAVNYLHNFLLVLLLLQSMDKDQGRILFIGSTSIHPNWWPNATHYPREEQKILFTSVDALARGESPIENDFHAGQRRYAMSKVMMIMFMYVSLFILENSTHNSKVQSPASS
jgi:NAD(P)-dependent dehydrogenase (short-subunit alcohol dehydrogenase family)